ncbi:MAG TPA: hypothetical protein VN667_12940, partial [Burkholderiales bacterium]|nr:hypothetical protein [Burkholderiales bacterium]
QGRPRSGGPDQPGVDDAGHQGCRRSEAGWIGVDGISRDPAGAVNKAMPRAARLDLEKERGITR